jgi:hypothetical protein
MHSLPPFRDGEEGGLRLPFLSHWTSPGVLATALPFPANVSVNDGVGKLDNLVGYVVSRLIKNRLFLSR